MKALLLLTSVSFPVLALGDSAIPAPFEAARYEETLTNSPFVLATPPAEPEKVEEPHNLVVTGMGKLDDGRDYVLIQKLGEERSMRFEGNAPMNGYSVKKVNWADKWTQSTVVVKPDSGEEITVKFKEQPQQTAALVQNGRPPGAPGVPTPAGSRPMQAGGMTPTIPRPNSAGMPPVPRPAGGVTLPQPNGVKAPGVPPPGGITPTGGAPRQRVRTIQNR